MEFEYNTVLIEWLPGGCTVRPVFQDEDDDESGVLELDSALAEVSGVQVSDEGTAYPMLHELVARAIAEFAGRPLVMLGMGRDDADYGVRLKRMARS